MRTPKRLRSDQGAMRTRHLLAATAWRRAWLGLGCLPLASCEVPKEINPVNIYREVSGLADEGRRPPPGLDDPFPNLASVPPRPERPTTAAREAISAALVEDRSNSREPLVLRTAPAGPGNASPLGTAGLSAGPPPRPVLAVAPRVPWTEAPAGGGPEPASAPRRGADPVPARPGTPAPEVLAPEMPDAAPAAPPPDLLSVPPPPPPDLLAPQGAPRPR